MFENSSGAREDSVASVHCGQCGATGLKRTVRSDTFMYSAGSKQAKIDVSVPVMICSACGFSFTTSEAEDIRHEAVCRYLGVLTPAEISAIRAATGLSRERFSDVTGIGVASLARWESGELIQNVAYDRYLRLLTLPLNFQRLSHPKNVGLGQHTIQANSPRQVKQSFPALLSCGAVDVKRKAASCFQLRRAHS